MFAGRAAPKRREQREGCFDEHVVQLGYALTLPHVLR
jgi:hypothetical protein